MFKIILLIFITTSIYAVDLGEIDVNAKVAEDVKQSVANDIFEEVEYIESNSYMPRAAGQKRLTTEEALFIPGVQGDPVKALKFIGGVSTSSSGFGSGGELYIYGSKPEESSYSINHLPIGYIFHMGGLHSVIDPNAIDQIDAYLAGFDSTYGDAMGGVIDITPKYPSDEISGYGHIGIFDASTGINVPLGDDTSFFLGARRSYFDIGYELIGSPQPKDSNNTIIQFPSYYDLTFIFSHNIDDENIFSIESITAYDTVELITQTQAVKDPKATGNIAAENGFTSIGARWLNSSGNYNGNTLAYYMYKYSDIELFTDYYIKNTVELAGLFHESTLEYDNHKLVAGFEFSKSKIPLDMKISKPPSPEDTDFDFTTADIFSIDRTIEMNSFALFLQDIYSLTDELKFRIGTRLGYSDYQNFGSYIDPRVSVIYDFDDAQGFSASVGRYTKMPEGFKTSNEIGNTELPFESAMHYVLHYDYKYSQSSIFSIEPFYKDYDSLSVDDNITNYEGVGDGYAYGIDTSIKYKEGDLYGFLSYTYLRSKRQTSTNSSLSDFYAEIPHTLQFVGAMRFYENWVFSSLMKYNTGALYTPIIATKLEPITNRVLPVRGDDYSERLPDYFTLNFKIARTIKYPDKTSLEWSFELMNITNHENVLGYTYDDNYNKTGVKADLPTLPWFDVTYRF